MGPLVMGPAGEEVRGEARLGEERTTSGANALERLERNHACQQAQRVCPELLDSGRLGA